MIWQLPRALAPSLVSSMPVKLGPEIQVRLHLLQYQNVASSQAQPQLIHTQRSGQFLPNTMAGHVSMPMSGSGEIVTGSLTTDISLSAQLLSCGLNMLRAWKDIFPCKSLLSGGVQSGGEMRAA